MRVSNLPALLVTLCLHALLLKSRTLLLLSLQSTPPFKPQNSQSGHAQRFPTNAMDNENRVNVHTTLIVPSKIKRPSKPFAMLHTHAQKQLLVQATNRSDLVPGAVLAHAELASQLESAEGLAGSQLQDSCLLQGCSCLQGCQQPWDHLACLPPAPP